MLITSDEAIAGAKVKTLTKGRRGKFKKGGPEIGDIVFIKSIHGDPWKNSGDLIWVTKDGKEDSESFGYFPEELELVK